MTRRSLPDALDYLSQALRDGKDPRWVAVALSATAEGLRQAAALEVADESARVISEAALVAWGPDIEDMAGEAPT